MKTRPPTCSQTSRRNRRRRLRASPPTTPDDARNCYLGTVPDDSLRIVLRFLSHRPQHLNWHAYISARRVNTVLNVGGALARAALSEFHGIGGKDGVPFDTDDDASILRPLVYRLPLRRLTLKLPGEKVLPDLLRRCGAELREMVLYGTVFRRTDILAVSTQCTKLSSLAIHGNRVEGTLAPIWRSIGFTLSRIHICRKILGAIAGPYLVRHCLMLRRVDVLSLNDVIADVLVALGSRIRVLGIGCQSDTTIAPWLKVCDACTNLEAVHLALEGSSEEAINILTLMRTKLASLTLQSYVLLTEERFYTALSACSVLKRVRLHVLPFVTEELICKLFESIPSVTTMTCIARTFDVSLNKSIIDGVARNLTSLESLTMSADTPFEVTIVNALVDLPHLKSVTLRAPSFKNLFARPAEECAVEVVKRLKDCTQLVQLEIDDGNIKHRSQLIAEAAAMYGRKDFDMYIGGVQYRTW